MKIFKFFLLFIILTATPAVLFGQPSFGHLGIEKGLSNNSVNTIYKDHFGFMWFGTDDGLNQYNGYSLRVFRNNPNDTTSLLNNQVVGLAEDADSQLWVATKRGIQIYHSKAAKFIIPQFLAINDGKLHKLDHEIYSIKSNAGGNILIGSVSLGLLIYDHQKKETHQVPFSDAEKLIPYSVRAIKALKDKAWLINPAKGLAYYDYKTDGIILVNKSGDIRNANTIEEDHFGNLWIGTDHGLFKYNIASNSLKRYSSGPGQLSAERILALEFEGMNTLQIATDGGGVNKLDLRSDRFSYLMATDGVEGLSSNAVSSIFRDQQNRTWYGTLRGGVNILDKKKNEFRTIARDPLNKQTLVSDFILSFCEDADNNIWIGTDGSGISVWNGGKDFRSYRHDPSDPTSLSSNNVTSIVSDKDGAIWVATFGGGINRYDRNTHVFKHYTCSNNWGKNDDNIWKLFFDSHGTLWAGTCVGRGLLYRFDPVKDSFEPIYSEHLSNIISINEDSAGNLWLGSFSHLFKRTVDGAITVFPINYPVRAIFFSKNKDLWIGTQYAGLLKFDQHTGKFKAYTETDGLSNNTVLNIEEDDHHDLWMSTFNGITKFNYQTGVMNKFYLEDGLQSSEFNYNASIHLRSGQLAFGGIRGFNIFNPDSVTSAQEYPPLRLTDFQTLNEPLSGDADDAEGLNSIKEIEVPYDKAVISFEYCALEYSFPTRISYSYYLEGLEKKWNQVKSARSGSYSRLAEGTYILHIRSTNAAGKWNPNELTIKIRVLPPWYRSWIAYIAYLMIFLYLIYRYNRYREKQMRLNYEIEMANTNAEKDRELNERKLSFFTHISHEFRTPLTLIINPIRELLYNAGKNLDASDLSIVYLNAKRLLSLVDQLLLFRKADHEEGELKLSRLDIDALCKDVFLCFSNQARLKNINFTFYNDSDQTEILADREKIEIVLFNLISNAFKFTPDNGEIAVNIHVSEATVQINVVDNGQGIPSDIGEKLFDKFYQVEGSKTLSVKGFGIGLYLAKKFISAHKGQLSYTSEKGKGADFSIILLRGDGHFQGLPVYEQEIQPVAPTVIVPEPEEINTVQEEQLQSLPDLDNLTSELPALLVVDDNEGIRNYIYKMFKDAFVIYQAANGQEGLNMVKKHLPDIVVSDVTMPVMDGIEFCRQIKNDQAVSHIPVVLLTSSTASEIKLKGLECGAEDYITKPFEADLFNARIHNILKSRTSLQRYFYNEITLQTDNQKISPAFKDFLSRCIAITEQHLDDPDFNAKVLASEVGLSQSALYKRVKSISGKSINEFIRFIRLRKAAELLVNSDARVNEAAFQAGFNNQKYFREQFVKLFQMTPTAYIKKYRKH